MSSIDEILTVAEAQKVLRVSRSKMYQLIHEDGFPAIRLGRIVRIPRQALLDWVDAQQKRF